jgi:hypothetical protein
MVRQEDEQHEAAMVNEPDDDYGESSNNPNTNQSQISQADNDDAEMIDYTSEVARFAIDLLEFDFYYFSASLLSDRSKFVSFLDRIVL